MAPKVKTPYIQGIEALSAAVQLFGTAKGEAIQSQDIMSAYNAERREEEAALSLSRAAGQVGFKVPGHVQTVLDRITVRNSAKKSEAVAA